MSEGNQQHLYCCRQRRRRTMLFLLFCNWLLPSAIQAQEGPNFDLYVPLFGTPNNNEGGTFRHDFCNLSLQVVAGKISLDHALNGVDLHILLADGAFVNFEYNTTDNGTILHETVRLNERYAGLVPDILDTICESAGCRWRNSYYPIFYSELDGRTFNELLSWSVDIYDMNAEWWMRSIDRLASGANYAEKWYDGSIIMVQKKKEESQDKFDPWGWLAPFDTSVWFLVLGTLGFSALVYWFLEWLNPDSDGSGDDDMLQPSHILWLAATSFAGQFEFDPQTGPARLFTFSIAFWALLMTSAYTANLASFLVIRNNPHIRIDTLEQAVSLERTMCVWQSSQTDLTLTADFPAYATQSGLLTRTNHKGVFQGLRDDDCEIAVTEVSSWAAFQNDKSVNENCDLEVTGQIYNNVPASFTMKSDAGILCTSLLRDVLNVHMFKMELNGDLEELWEKYQKEIATAECSAGLAGGTSSRRRRRKLDTSLLEDNKTQQQHRRLNEEEEARRQLKTVAARAGAAGAGAEAAATTTATTTTKLSLTNMGGVFLLHGILSALSIVLALIPWFYNRYYDYGKDDPNIVATSVEITSLTQFPPASSSTSTTDSGGGGGGGGKAQQQRPRARSFDSAQGAARYVDVMDLRDDLNTRFGEMNDRFARLEKRLLERMGIPDDDEREWLLLREQWMKKNEQYHVEYA